VVRRLALVLALVALVLPAAAGAQLAPDPLGQQQQQTPTTNAAPPPSSNQTSNDSGGLTGSIVIPLIIIGAVILLGTGYMIVRDAHRRAPVADFEPEDATPSKARAARHQRQRTRAKAARRQRRRNRAR